MGLYEKGILGKFKGLVGTVVGATWRTLDVMKSKPTKSNKPPVQAQIDQRFIFAMVVAFLAKIDTTIALGFRGNTGVITPMNAAVSYNIEHAVTGISPDFSINYPELGLSKGTLPIAFNAAAAPATGRNLNVTWDTITGGDPTDAKEMENQTDKAVLMIYNPARGLFMKVSTATRASGKVTAKLNFLFDGENHAYLFFAQAKGKKVSNTQYLGEFLTVE